MDGFREPRYLEMNGPGYDMRVEVGVWPKHNLKVEGWVWGEEWEDVRRRLIEEVANTAELLLERVRDEEG